MRILLVDDQKSLRRSLSLMLQGASYETSEAESGDEALHILAQWECDLVISDLRMDGMSGIDLLQEIRRIRPQLPVILITAYGSIESAVEAMRRGLSTTSPSPSRNRKSWRRSAPARSCAAPRRACRGARRMRAWATSWRETRRCWPS